MATTYRYCYQEIKRLFYFPTFRSAIILLLAIIALTTVLFASNTDRPTFSWLMIFVDSFNVALYFGTLGMIIVAVHYAASEYQNRTLQLSVAAGIPRWTFVFGKSLALIAGAYCLVFITGISSLAISATIASFMGAFTIKSLSLTHLLLTLLLSPLRIFPLMFLAFFLTVLARSAIFPLSLLVFYVTLGEVALVSFVLPSPLKDLLPGQIAKSLDTITTFKINASPNIATIERIARETAEFKLTYWASIEGVLAYIITLGLLAYIVLRNQDLSR